MKVSQLLTAIAFVPVLIMASVAPPSLVGRNNDGGFVTVQDGEFYLDGKDFVFGASNAYWLHQLNDQDIDTTFASMASNGIKAVTTWAFDDVLDQPPSSGVFFQLFKDGHITLNEAGLQRLDQVVSSAANHGIKLILALSNNWFPSTKGEKYPYPHGYLSNSYGGADAYVEALAPGGTHDEFFTNPTIIAAFKSYVQTIVTRYANSTTVLSWEIIQDARCFSTLPASPSCNPQTITKWYSELSSFIKSIDSNHLIGSGDGGFYCVGCPKLFPSKDKRAIIPAETAPYSKRQSLNLVGPGYDGSQGIDTEDISNVPTIDYLGFQFFPDQNSYGPVGAGPDVDRIQSEIDGGIIWIDQHVQTAACFKKPVAFTGFGVVTQDNAPFFVPPNSSTVVTPPPGYYFPDNAQQYTIYDSWLNESLAKHVGGVVLYQWFETGLSGGSPSGRRQAYDVSGVVTSGSTPNDGYAATPSTEARVGTF